MDQNFNFIDNSKGSISDIKKYIFRVLANWKWFLLTIPIALSFAHYKNISTQRIYGLNSTISIKEKQNPLFASGTSIAFNWGGTSDQVESIKRVLSSRSHNEQVLKDLQFYIQYLKEGRFRIEDAYGETPFVVRLEKDKFQLLNTIIKIDFIDAINYNLTIDFGEQKTKKVANYDLDKTHIYDVVSSKFSEKFELDKPINLPFLNITLESLEGFGDVSGKSFMISFKSINDAVKQYNNVRANSVTNTSMLNVTSMGANKKRLVDYINRTVEVLVTNQLEKKTDYAYQTLEFIDEQFKNTQDSLRLIEDNIGDYKEAKNIYNLSAEGSQIFSETTGLDRQQVAYAERLEYYKNLENYINTSRNYSSIPAPAIIDIEDASISSKITTLTKLSIDKEKLQNEVTDNHPTLVALNQQIESAKDVLLENVSSIKNVIQLSLKNSKRRLNNFNYQLKKLPKKEQGLLVYQRKYAMTEGNFRYLLQKRYEADIAIAASVSDITILDKAKDTGQVSTMPRKSFNYMVGLLLGTVLPLFVIVGFEVFNNKVQTVEEVEELTPIPLLGVVGKSTAKNNLAIALKPKSVVAEAFRALRSNIHFLFDRSTINKPKTILITSSVSGEGKTFVSINMATVFALSGKKTVLIGLDLRKPKIFDDFNVTNDVGVVNYLIGQKTKEEIIQKTSIENLDLITAGPVPPNPSELILNDATNELLDYLKKHYDYIILDTPPVGLVADAFELLQFADATLYVVRQNFTHKGMLKMINDKYKKGELSKISVVLNDFKMKSKYGYGYGYGYGNGQGYYEREKEPFYKRLFKRK